jgi:hypothetical protein
MRKRHERTPAEVQDDARWFAAARQVLAGAAPAAIDASSLKLFGFLFGGECDATISNDGFRVRFTWNPGPHTYFMELAPTILGHLLKWASLSGPCKELCAAPLKPHGLRLATLLTEPGPEEPRLLWLRDGETDIRFSLRVDSPELRDARWPTEISARTRETAWRDRTPTSPSSGLPKISR